MPIPHPPEIPAFSPRLPWLGADLQTLRNSFRGPALSPPPGLTTDRLVVPLQDGSGDQLSVRVEHPPERRAGTPLVGLIHGLGGDETSTYLETSAAHLLSHGTPVMRINLRGAGPSRPLCRQQYHAGRTEDLRDLLAGLPEPLVGDGLVLAGFSLGGNMLLKFLAEHGTSTPNLRGALSISAPIDLQRSSRRILERRNVVYHRHLLRGMLDEARRAGDANTPEELEVLDEVRTILEFDDRLVSVRNGFAGAHDYYMRCSAIRFLPEIRVPTWVIHALDDPWIPGEMYTSFAWRDNPALTPLLPAGGGHVGFHPASSRVPWHDQCIAQLLSGLARESQEGVAQRGAA